VVALLSKIRGFCHGLLSHCIVEGDLCAVHCEVTGTHTGDGLGISATGRDVRFSGMCIIRVAHGQIQEAWNSFDFLSFYQQLGVLPALGQH
jgi:predicted ester cyclase